MAIEIINNTRQDYSNLKLESLLAFGMAQMEINPDCDLNLMLVDEGEMTELHIKWMDESGPTDVLSFPMDEIEPGYKELGVLGDIVLCPTVALSQAQKAGHSFEHEAAILSMHGLLHILGFDHAEPEEEKEMFALQESLVARWSK